MSKLNITTGGNQDYAGYIATFSGKVIKPFDPDPADIFIEDIAHALGNQCRFTGHTKHFYSVAQHSVLASHFVDGGYGLWALLHDGTEAYLADIARPVKAMWSQYKEYEDVLMKAIIDRFGLTDERPMPEPVKKVDDTLLASEIKYLMPEHEIYAGWEEYRTYPAFNFEMLTPEEATAEFLYRYKELGGEYVSLDSDAVLAGQDN